MTRSTVAFIHRFLGEEFRGDRAHFAAEMIAAAADEMREPVAAGDQPWVWRLCIEHNVLTAEVKRQCEMHRAGLVRDCFRRISESGPKPTPVSAREYAAALEPPDVESLIPMAVASASRIAEIRPFARSIIAAAESPIAHEALAALLPVDTVLVPSGEFDMGGPSKPDQLPSHRRWLPSFGIRKFPLTVSEARSLELSDELGADDLPASGISWFRARDALETTAWRMPTEAEWEKAARGPDHCRFPWGDSFEPDRANTQEYGLGERTPVDHFGAAGASGYGVEDMVGNVWEWTASTYKPYGRARYAPSDPRSPGATGDRVLRGGAYDWDQLGSNCLNRYRCPPDRGWDTHGIRLAVAI